MCGILGGINTNFTQDDVFQLHHRGPDQNSLTVQQLDEQVTVTLGQTRLNIVDREDIELPVQVNDSVILFNGEIYNYPELKKELQGFGWEFRTSTDTEVALISYLQWGPDCLSRFNGMFAFAIWDGKTFFCARDRMGKKPLFYRCAGNKFEFASEVKAFSNLEFISNELFDLFEFCFGEFTLYQDVYSLPPGHYLVYDLFGGTYHTKSYWDIEHRVGRRVSSESAAIDGLIELLEDATRLRMRADVPISLFLSGGLDSALIASLSGIKEAFTCQFAEFASTINEERFATDLAERLAIKLNVVRPNRDEFLEDVAALAYHLELPTGSFSVFPLYRLAKSCSEAGYKVILSGEGADELFAGYARNEFLLDEQRDAEDVKVHNYSSMLRRYDGSALDRFCRMASRSGLSGAGQMRTFLTQHWSPRKTMLENIAYVESRIFIQPLLQMSDRMCMAHSVEARCPYLDYRIIEYAFSLDDSLRFRDGTGKWIIHEAARKVLPKGSLVLDRKVKHGLPTPVNLWMQGRHSFDRKYWNTMMTTECIRSLIMERS